MEKDLKILLQRSLLSFSRISTMKKNTSFIYKIITLLNLLIKSYGLVRRASSSKLIKWPINDCIAKTNFFNIKYYFYMPKGYDFNVYMNPYFHEYDVTTLTYFYLKDGDNFIDVGAHGGLYTLIAVKK